MLNSIFTYKGFNLSDDSVLGNIVRACVRQIPRSINRISSWNVDQKALALPPFEPLCLASMRDLMRKILFLVALVTARRVNELQVLSNKAAWQDSDLVFILLIWVWLEQRWSPILLWETFNYGASPHWLDWRMKNVFCVLFGQSVHVCIGQTQLLALDSFSCQLETRRNPSKLLCHFLQETTGVPRPKLF